MAVGAYLTMFAAWVFAPLPIVNLMAAVMVWATEGKRSRFVAFHAYQSMLSQIPITGMNMGLVAGLIYAVVTKSFTTVLGVVVAATLLSNFIYFILSMVALFRARKGGFFYFPILGQIAFAKYYGAAATSLIPENSAPPNQPPPGF